MVYITHSTGIGTGVIVDGRCCWGAWVGGGNRPYDDQYVGGPENNGRHAGGDDVRAGFVAPDGAAPGAIAVRLNWRAYRGGYPEELARRREGDAFALEQYRLVGRYLGAGIVNILHVQSECIVIGEAYGYTASHARQHVGDHPSTHSRPHTGRTWRFARQRGGDDVGLLGAVALALDGLAANLDLTLHTINNWIIDEITLCKLALLACRTAARRLFLTLPRSETSTGVF